MQQGVRVKLPEGVTWDSLGNLKPDEIKQRDVFPQGFRPLPHVKHANGGQVLPPTQIEEIRKQEARELQRFDVEFDLPLHLTPEFPRRSFCKTIPSWAM